MRSAVLLPLAAAVLCHAQDGPVDLELKDTLGEYLKYKQTVTVAYAIELTDPQTSRTVAGQTKAVRCEYTFLLRQRQTGGQELEAMLKFLRVAAEWDDNGRRSSESHEWKEGKEFAANYFIKPTGATIKGDKDSLHNEIVRRTDNRAFARVASAYFRSNLHLWGFGGHSRAKPSDPWQVTLDVPLAIASEFDTTLTRTLELRLAGGDRFLITGTDKDFDLKTTAPRPKENNALYWLTYVDKKNNTTTGDHNIAFDPRTGVVTKIESTCQLVYTDGEFKFNGRNTRLKASLKIDIRVRKH